MEVSRYQLASIEFSCEVIFNVHGNGRKTGFSGRGKFSRTNMCCITCDKSII
jgi:hypothetical protein